MLAHRTTWSDRRVIDVLQIEHPIVLSPMAGIGTVDLAASVSAAGGPFGNRADVPVAEARRLTLPPPAEYRQNPNVLMFSSEKVLPVAGDQK
jgi:hypothetical protein